MAEQKKSKGLHIGLWVAQVLLAAAFGFAGFMKIATPIDQLAEGGMSFVNSFEAGMVRFIGISEVLGALGLILPAALRIKPVLTPIAAVGVAIIMVLATTYHVMHSETFLPNIILFALAVFVAWGRFKKAPIQAK
ncbi:putative oxidoreductase [Catalinimonas alkaloidigena]|uniref:DoxX family protein n=1 Tax=Catalinimonas alkaloidigena TaxID=1075417 RepID=UPI00240527C6|nr:DoxX family protein [Catalinimonas alkaloidigena]MDF9799402.1 putative oxidoreductase [Catalinimonas alkaloidigena]